MLDESVQGARILTFRSISISAGLTEANGFPYPCNVCNETITDCTMAKS